MKIDPGTPPSGVRGFRFSGVHGGLKKRGRRDFALIVADKPCVAAASFTTNRSAAAPVIVAREHAADGCVQAVLVNSGNANAATGEQGLKFARWSCRELASRLSIDESMIVPCSTGVIGVQLEKTPYSRAISLGVDGLSRKGLGAAARAMMTSDAYPKWTEARISSGESEMHVVGMAKGAGMIRPDMATMLAFIMTDAQISREVADAILRDALPKSFNRISVDGDTSTNDTVLLMASSQAAAAPIDTPSGAAYTTLCEGVVGVMDDLARKIVRDGEGATKLVDIVVDGAASEEDAMKLARAVSQSVLVKCAFAGADPNWGRFVMALGNAGVDYDESKISIHIDDVLLARDGTVVSAQALRSVRKAMAADAFTVRISVGNGRGSATVVTSDLTEAYVHFNSAYTS